MDKDLSLLAVWLHKKMQEFPPLLCLPGTHHPEKKASQETWHRGTQGATRAICIAPHSLWASPCLSLDTDDILWRRQAVKTVMQIWKNRKMEGFLIKRQLIVKHLQQLLWLWCWVLLSEQMLCALLNCLLRGRSWRFRLASGVVADVNE
jgi:hypothetical protein